MAKIVDYIVAPVAERRAMVAIDGVDGSGKTTFAAGLARAIAVQAHRPVLVLHVDRFLNPSSIRHGRGRRSPEGFWHDSYNYDALRTYALEPLSAHGSGQYRPAAFDPTADEAIEPQLLCAPPNALVLVEGMFLHRDELVDSWDVSLFLDVPFSETARRMAARDGSHPDPEDASMRRYVEGQRLYFRSARPWERASLTIDNTDVGHPRIIPAEESAASAAIR